MWYALKIVVVLVGVASLITNVVQSSVSPPARQFSYASAEAPAGADSCVECHESICEQFHNVPITRAHVPASDPKMLARYDGREFTMPDTGLKSRFFAKEGKLFLESDAYPFPVHVDYIFGSGLHAQTPVTIFKGPNGEARLFSHKISWYPNETVDVTLGMDHYHYPTGRKAMGDLVDAVTTRRCMSCHSTHMPINKNDHIEFKRTIHGVSCERCHLNGKKHIRESRAVPQKFSRVPWKELTPYESIGRCGECHRRVDQLAEIEIDSSNLELIRFASVGIPLSKCFKEQGENPPHDKRLDCMTCHDPHGNLVQGNPQYYVDKCLQCHSSKSDGASNCRAQPMTSNCLTCHLPTVNVQKNLSFTDHWIRVRSKSDPKSVRPSIILENKNEKK